MGKSSWHCDSCGEDTHCPECSTCLPCVEESHRQDMKKPDRRDVLLRAAYDIFKKCEESPEVLEVHAVTAQYDDTECDGYCLQQEIEDLLGIEDE